jgi:hypothetical protein
MKRTMAHLIRAALAACALGAVGLSSAHAVAQDMDAPPPPEYIATVEPVYYEGHPAYWYNNHWFYRDERGAWGHYREEPGFLRDRRFHSPPNRYHYAGRDRGFHRR